MRSLKNLLKLRIFKKTLFSLTKTALNSLLKDSILRNQKMHFTKSSKQEAMGTKTFLIFSSSL